MPSVNGVEEKTLTCLITIVNPGQSDKVIKVTPANGKSEKVWLDNANGIRRWEAITRFFDNYAEKGTAVPKPAPYHSDTKDLKLRDLQDEDIPVVRLQEGEVFKVFTEPAYTPVEVVDEKNDRIERLESTVNSLMDLVKTVISNKREDRPVTAEATAPVATKAEMVNCDKCGKECKAGTGLKVHRAKCLKKG